MANQTDRSTLPNAELNPLVNPLLGRNMGRWAEVYFNAVPEKREEAVQGLLRELEAEEERVPSGSAHESDRSSFGRTNSFSESHSSESKTQSVQKAESSTVRVCSSCGHDISVDQKFCGMCGAVLRPEVGYIEHFDPSPGNREYEFREPRLRDSYSEERSGYSYAREEYGDRGYQDYDPNLDHMFELSPSYSHSYRVVIAGAVAIIAVGLAYVAWRSGQMTSALMRLRGELPSSVTQQQPAQPQNPSQAGNANAPQAAVPSNATPAPAQPQASSQPKEEDRPEEDRSAEAAEGKTHSNESATPNKPPVKPQPASARGVSVPDNSVPDNGAQELGIAQGYLNSSNGHQADRAEAAQWLWKAVGKRNLEATLLLSDLYLHGEGVAKNCDQARILLDAAATRGNGEAAVRLRHLQAFGCQ